MSKEMRQQIDRVKNWKQILNENKSTYHVVEVPQGSYNFKFGFNEFENVQTLFYDVKQSYSRSDGSGFGGDLKHSEDVDLPEGKWEIFEIKPLKVILKRVG
jgi:hypothetical protein